MDALWLPSRCGPMKMIPGVFEGVEFVLLCRSSLASSSTRRSTYSHRYSLILSDTAFNWTLLIRRVARGSLETATECKSICGAVNMEPRGKQDIVKSCN
jgi:hypothetical protein